MPRALVLPARVRVSPTSPKSSDFKFSTRQGVTESYKGACPYIPAEKTIVAIRLLVLATAHATFTPMLRSTLVVGAVALMIAAPLTRAGSGYPICENGFKLFSNLKVMLRGALTAV